MAEESKNFQFRDLRAKAATDKDDAEGLGPAQDQLGHTTPAMTAHYVRHRRGEIVKLRNEDFLATRALGYKAFCGTPAELRNCAHRKS